MLSLLTFQLGLADAVVARFASRTILSRWQWECTGAIISPQEAGGENVLSHCAYTVLAMEAAMNESLSMEEMKGKIDFEWGDGIYIDNFHLLSLSWNSCMRAFT